MGFSLKRSIKKVGRRIAKSGGASAIISSGGGEQVLSPEIKELVEKALSGEKKALGSPIIIVQGGAPAIQAGGQPVQENGEVKLEGENPEEGVDLTKLEVRTKRELRKKDESSDITLTDIKYPLIPFAPKQGERVMAWVHICWDPSLSCLVYKVHEPFITPEEKKHIDKIKSIIEEEIDVDFNALGKEGAKQYLDRQIRNLLNRMGLSLTPEKLEVYRYYIERDFLGFGRIEPILRDENIEDISCDGLNVPVYVYHRDSKLGSLVTNVVYTDAEELDNLIRKFAQRCGKSVSMANPLLEGALPDGSRLQAVLATDIAARGSNFTIRKFSKLPMTPINMLNYRTMDSRLLAYLWVCVEHGSSILIVGATAAGKTSILNALSMFIKPNAKVVSIEDTPELRLPHEHWVPEVARESVEAEEGGGEGTVTMFDLLKGSLRQRPDYIIVGEIRGREAAVLFQQMATGHPGLSTFHADSLEKVINRLITRPINLPPSLLDTLDLLLFAKRLRYKGRYIRRVVEVDEVLTYDLKNNNLKTNKVFEWDSMRDEIVPVHRSLLLQQISKNTGIPVGKLKQEIVNRMRVLEWMQARYITHYKRVGEVIKAYYNDPDSLLQLVEEDGF